MRRVKFLLIFLFLILSFGGGDYNFYRLNDEPVSYKDLVASSTKTVFLLWTTWCYFCRKELVRINDCAKDYKDVEFYYVNLGEEKKIIQKTVRKLKLKSCIKDNIILDKESILAQELEIIGIPAYVFFKDGEFVRKSNFISEEMVERVFEGE